MKHAAVACLLLLAAAAAVGCNGTATPPDHYGKCPVGQHWVIIPSGPPECAR